MLDALTADLDDPAQVFAQGFRLTGRLRRRLPELSKVLLYCGFELSSMDKGLVPRVRRDIEAATRVGRFTAGDTDLAVVHDPEPVGDWNAVVRRVPQADQAA
ncbi:hypothetical protein ABZX92_37600 [Lentzea sp. NPDC006480]|uniref:hypothetical protein n=1 Tax=Lentzea sp. NPDC006480 TaxID=3157176 RepID=UPI0033BF3C71